MNIKNPQGRLARWITRLTAFDMEFIYRKGEFNEVADCVSRNSLAARLAKIKVIKHDGAHSALNSAAREQALAKIRDLKKAETGDRVTQQHAEFKQLSTQTKGGVGLFEVTLRRTVARTEAEQVEIGENEKDSDYFSECPPCHEGGEIKRALRWSSQPLDVPAEQRAVNLPREAIRRAPKESDEICKLIKQELESKTTGNLQLSREVMLWKRESFVRSAAKGKGKSPARLRHGRSEPSLCEIITRRFGRVIEGNTPRMMKFRNVFSGRKCERRGYQQFCLDMQGLPDG